MWGLLKRRLLLLILTCLWAAPVWADTPVHPADNDLQAKINAAACGDTLVLDAGGVWSASPYYLPNKSCPGPAYLTITGSAALPVVCTILLAPCRTAWPSTTTNFPVLTSNDLDSTLVTNFGASYYKLQGITLENTRTLRDGTTVTIFYMGTCGNTGCGAYTYAHLDSELPNHIWMDRVYVHGNPTGDSVHGIMADADNVIFENSYLEDIHSTSIESHGFVAQNSAGPVTIHNNYISASGITLFFGSNGVTIDQNATNVTITGNYLTKQCKWYVNAASVGCADAYDGYGWLTKNSLEFKRCVTCTVDGNIIENSWDGFGQTGEVVIMQMVAEYAIACPGCFNNVTVDNTTGTISGITFTNNIIRHGAEGMVLNGRVTDFQCGGVCYPSPVSNGITVRNNLFYDLSSAWSPSNLGTSNCIRTQSGWKNITIDHNTCDNDGTGSVASTVLNFYQINSDHPADFLDNFRFTNSFGRQNQYGLKGNGIASGTPTLDALAPGPTWTWSHMVLQEPTAGAITYPATTDQITQAAFEAIFVDRAVGHHDDAVDYHIVNGSPYKAGGASQASDGLAIGVTDFSLLPDPAGGIVAAAPASGPIRLRRR